MFLAKYIYIYWWYCLFISLYFTFLACAWDKTVWVSVNVCMVELNHTTLIAHLLVCHSTGSWDSLLAKVPDSSSKGCEFEPWQKQQENFFSRVNFVCWLLFGLFHPHVTAVARKRPTSFCQKCRWQVTPKTPTHPSLSEVGAGWLCSCPGIVWEPIGKQAHMQLIREHSVTVNSARWASMDSSWPQACY